MKTDGDSLVRQGIDFIYNVEFDSAEHRFELVRQMYPEHPSSYFMAAMVDWWRIFLDKRHTSHDAPLLEKLDRVEEVCDSLLEAEPRNVTALFFKGGALGYRGRYHVLRKNYFDAATTGRDALEVLTESQKIAPGNHDIMLGTGIYNYFAEVIPDKHPYLKPALLFLPKGDKKLGLLQLRAAANQAQYASVEAKVVLIQAYYSWEDEPAKAYPYARDLAAEFPRNPAFKQAFARCLVRLGPLDSMEAVWREILLSYIAKETGYDEFAARESLYYIGVSRMLRNDFDLALRYLYKCDEASRLVDSEPTGFMAKTNLKIGQMYDVQGKRELALKQYQKVLDWDNFDTTHELAERYIETPYK